MTIRAHDWVANEAGFYCKDCGRVRDPGELSRYCPGIPPASLRITKALELAVSYGGIDGDRHKAWVIDQMVRALTGCVAGGESSEYLELVARARDGEDGPETYSWDVGVAP